MANIFQILQEIINEYGKYETAAENSIRYHLRNRFHTNDDATNVSEVNDLSVDIEFIPWSRYATELLRGEIIALIFLRFIGLFGQTW